MPADIPDQPEETNEDAHSDGQGEEAPDVPRLRDPGEPTQSEIDIHAQTTSGLGAHTVCAGEPETALIA